MTKVLKIVHVLEMYTFGMHKVYLMNKMFISAFIRYL
jgi:hypothetical protein